MYRIAKTLNHNSFIGVEEGNNREYLVMGKGIAFGKKTEHHKRWENEKTDSADDANVTWRKAGRYRNRCSKRRGRRCSD